MSVIVSQGNSPYKVSAGGTDSNDVVVSGGSMFVLSGGVANLTTVSSGGFLTINKGGSGSSSQLLGGTETVSGTEIRDLSKAGLSAGRRPRQDHQRHGRQRRDLGGSLRRDGECRNRQQWRHAACCRRRCRRRRHDQPERRGQQCG